MPDDPDDGRLGRGVVRALHGVRQLVPEPADRAGDAVGVVRLRRLPGFGAAARERLRQLPRGRTGADG